MESSSLTNNQVTNSPLADNDISLSHFSEWSRADKLAFASLIIGLIGTISICLAFASILYAHRSERRETLKIMKERQEEANKMLNEMAPQTNNAKED